MYQKAERQCPNCLRELRIKPNNEGLYCPDTLRCKWTTRSTHTRGRASYEHLREMLDRARQEKDALKIERIKTLFYRCAPQESEV